MPNSPYLKDLQSLLSEDGSAFDRMNAGQGGEAYPQWFRNFAERLKQEGVTDATVADWLKQNKSTAQRLILEA